jgi:predicted Zn finger-like uncharacterized protein
MRLVCLECSAAYEAPDNLFGPQPREVRCNRCGYQWTVIGSRPGETVTPSALSIGPAEQPAPATTAGMIPQPQPAPAVPEAPVPEAAVLPPPPQPVPQPAPQPAPQPVVESPRAAARLADSLAGPLPPPASPPPPPIANELAPPAIVVEPQAASTRSLLAHSATTTGGMDAPDPEERRLSHELDFGEAERGRRTRQGTGGARRAALLLIVLIAVVIIAAVMFKPQIIAAVPATKAAYTAVGL